MKTRITIGQIRLAIENRPQGNGMVTPSPLNKLASASLSASMMYWFGRIANEAREHHKDIAAQMDGLLTKFGAPAIGKDDQGNDIEIPGQFTLEGNAQTEYQSEFDDLMKQSVEIAARTFTVEELDKYSAKLELVGFTGNDMTALDWLLVWPESELKQVESIEDRKAAKAAASGD